MHRVEAVLDGAIVAGALAVDAHIYRSSGLAYFSAFHHHCRSALGHHWFAGKLVTGLLRNLIVTQDFALVC